MKVFVSAPYQSTPVRPSPVRAAATGIVTALNLIRLDYAETLLARSNLNISEIARTCGYDDPLHFSRRFRTAYGTSPRQYRRAQTGASPLSDAGLLPLVRRLTAP